MSWIEAIVLGIIQGLTEFLPISSTAHLRIIPALLNWPDRGATVTAIIQLGTLVAVFWYFRRELYLIAGSWISETVRGKFCQSQAAKMGWLMIAGTVPVIVAGLTFQERIKSDWRSLYVIAGAMIGLALLMLVAELLAKVKARRGDHGRRIDQVGWGDALAVGLSQAVALVPGASRSGTTITGALFCGLNREAAARLSFLLSLPAVFAAGAWETFSAFRHPGAEVVAWPQVVVCTLVSGIVGYAVIALLIHYLRRHTTYVFIVYRIALGLGLLYALQAGLLPAL